MVTDDASRCSLTNGERRKNEISYDQLLGFVEVSGRLCKGEVEFYS